MTRITLLLALLLQASFLITVGQVDVSRLPEVTVYVNVTDEAGNPVRTLSQTDFAISEDGTPVMLTGFAGVSDSRPVDVVFVFDTTSSMREEIDGVIQTCVNFAEELERSGRDYRLGLVTFGDAVRDVYAGGNNLTDDVNVFKGWMNKLEAIGGGDDPENSLGALKRATQMNFRDDSQVVFIFITDAPAHHYGDFPETEGGFDDPDLTYEATLGLLTDPRAITIYSVAYDDPEFRNFASDTGGKFYDLENNSDFTDIIDDLGVTIATQYRLTYTTPRPNFDGTRRNIQVSVGGSTIESVYAEPHLLSIQSNPRVALAALCPLILALTVPPMAMAIFKKKSVSIPMPPPIPTVLPPQPPPTPIPGAGPPANAGLARATAFACPHCGNQLRPGAKFCAKCGQPTTAPLLAAARTQCPHCGQAVRPGAKFCGSCGWQI